MKPRLSILSLVIILYSFSAMAQKPQSYLEVKDLPDIMKFLPAPPAEGSHAFAADKAMHDWARSLEPGERTERATREATTNLDTMAIYFSGAFGRLLSEQTTPVTMHLLRRSIRTFRAAATKPKHAYHRTRPYVYYGENTLFKPTEEKERGTGSYPSGHPARGWGMALVLSQLNPERQDTLLAVGYEWGQSRVIANYHWQSDVDASRLMTSAVFARLQNCEQYLKDLEAAREEISGTLANVDY